MRMSTYSEQPIVPSVSIEAEPKDVKIDIVSEDVKAFDATQTHAQVQTQTHTQVHPSDNVKEIVNLVNLVA